MFKKLREWVEDEHDDEVEFDEVDGHAHEYRPHSGRYQEDVFVWEVDICRRCHNKRDRPKAHKHKTKSVTIEAGIPVFKKEDMHEEAALVDAQTGEVVAVIDTETGDAISVETGEVIELPTEEILTEEIPTDDSSTLSVGLTFDK